MPVAVKELKNVNANELQLELFIREINLLTKLRPHPNVGE